MVRKSLKLMKSHPAKNLTCKVSGQAGDVEEAQRVESHRHRLIFNSFRLSEATKKNILE